MPETSSLPVCPRLLLRREHGAPTASLLGAASATARAVPRRVRVPPLRRARASVPTRPGRRAQASELPRVARRTRSARDPPVSRRALVRPRRHPTAGQRARGARVAARPAPGPRAASPSAGWSLIDRATTSASFASASASSSRARSRPSTTRSSCEFAANQRKPHAYAASVLRRKSSHASSSCTSGARHAPESRERFRLEPGHVVSACGVEALLCEIARACDVPVPPLVQREPDTDVGGTALVSERVEHGSGLLVSLHPEVDLACDGRGSTQHPQSRCLECGRNRVRTVEQNTESPGALGRGCGRPRSFRATRRSGFPTRRRSPPPSRVLPAGRRAPRARARAAAARTTRRPPAEPCERSRASVPHGAGGAAPTRSIPQDARARTPGLSRASRSGARQAVRPDDGEGSCRAVTRCGSGLRRRASRSLSSVHPAAKTREARAEPLLLLLEQVVAPGNRCPEGGVAWVGVRPPRRRSSRSRRRSSSSSGERRPVRAAASSRASGRPSRRRQSSGTAGVDSMLPLDLARSRKRATAASAPSGGSSNRRSTLHPERLAARREQPQLRGRGEQLRDGRCVRKQMLEVVEHDVCSPAAER